MNKQLVTLAKEVGTIGIKLSKRIFVEGGKAVLAGAMVIGMEKIYKGGMEEIKNSKPEEFFEEQ